RGLGREVVDVDDSRRLPTPVGTDVLERPATETKFRRALSAIREFFRRLRRR
ncbi:DNA polymerase III subunit epsilon, partial [Rhodococcus sp. IITR03]